MNTICRSAWSKDLFGAELEETVLIGFWAKGALLFLMPLALLELDRSEESTITDGRDSTSSSAEDTTEPLL